MKKFTKDNLRKSGMYLEYHSEDAARPAFVARFKYRGAPVSMAQFKKELIKNHSVESYFSQMESGKAPLTILKEKNPVWYQDLINKFICPVH